MSLIIGLFSLQLHNEKVVIFIFKVFAKHNQMDRTGICVIFLYT